jgi:hypothetical protein
MGLYYVWEITNVRPGFYYRVSLYSVEGFIHTNVVDTKTPIFKQMDSSFEEIKTINHASEYAKDLKLGWVALFKVFI